MSTLVAIIAMTTTQIRCFFAKAKRAQQKLPAALAHSKILSYLLPSR